ncbi:MAG: VCBS repeat-containing protein, partial [Planctomycetota bacterium]
MHLAHQSGATAIAACFLSTLAPAQFASPAEITTALRFGSAMTTLDMNADGRTDILLVEGFPNRINWLRQLSSGEFAPLTTYTPTVQELAAVMAADWNSDGRIDLLGANRSGQLRLYRGEADGLARVSIP